MDFKADYAASGRSRCFRCKEIIAEGELRLGPNVQAANGDYKYPQWHHFACFEDGFMKQNPGCIESLAAIAGVDRLKFEDLKRVKALVTGGDAAMESRAANKEEKALAQQSKLVWKRVSQLEALTAAELTVMLEANKQPYSGKRFGGRPAMLQRAADGMVFGALPPCPVCGGNLFFSQRGVYQCTGNIDEFTPCEHSSSEVRRGSWVIPDDLKAAHAFLSSYSYVSREKVALALDVVPPSGKRPRPVADDAATAAAPVQCFAGRVITCVGKLSRTQKAVEDLITANGGTFVKSVAADICVTTFDEVSGKGSQKGRDVVAKGLLCVSEGWLDECLKLQRPLTAEESTPFVLANPRTSTTDSTKRQHRAEIAAAIAAAAAAGEEGKEEGFTSSERTTEEKAPPAQRKSAVRKVVVKGTSAVDEESGLVDEGHIYSGTSGDVYNVTLNRADVTTGQNSFYILQVIEHDRKAAYTTFRRWGKVGDDTAQGSKTTTYPSAEAAVREFTKTFLDKTGNEWSQRGNFKKAFGKFIMLEIDYGSAPTAHGPRNDASYSGPLDRSTQDFIKLIFDLKMMNDALLEFEIDTAKMPLGKLSQRSINEGFAALSDLQRALEETDATGRRSKLVSGSNRFYTFVPHATKAGETLPLIDTREMVRAKVELLTSLSEMEIATKLMSNASAAGEHPIDANYKKLKAELRGVPRNTELWERINNYLQNTHAATHTAYSLELVDLLEIDHEGDDEKFKPHATNANRMLLWHGSRLTNWVGIVSQGLRIAPPEAPSTGYMFGKGLYFADMASKSANYCFTTSEKTTGVLMLCEVALGNMQQRKAAFYETAIPNATHQSTFGVGKNHPDPRAAFREPSGCVIPLGKGVPSPTQDTSLLYNEFIVYDTAQVRPRYILRLNFKYKTKTGTFF